MIEKRAAVALVGQSEWPNLGDPETMYEKDRSREEKKQWEKWEATQDYDGMWSTEGKPTLPKRCVICVVRRFHNKVGGEAEATASQIKKEEKMGSSRNLYHCKKDHRQLPSLPEVLKYQTKLRDRMTN